MKKYNVGLVIGRFQPLHKGHEMMIESALDHCNKVVVVIGSAQASGTKENPLNWADRYTILLKRFREECDSQRLFIIPVNDREKYSDDPSFGEYIHKQITSTLGSEFTPDCIIEGKESKHSDWWKSISPRGHIEVDRGGIDVSGTALRNAIGNSDKEYINKYQSVESQEYNFKIWEIMNRCKS
jgi:cytidyltransferase-like protein